MCPATNEHCHYCKKQGHRAKVCFKKEKDERSNAARGTRQHLNKRTQVHQLEHDITEEDNTDGEKFVLDADKATHIHMVKTSTQAYANIEMAGDNGTDILIQCKIDSGAEVDVMPLRVFHRLFPTKVNKWGKPTGLQQCSVNLTAYGDNHIKLYSIKKITCTHKDITRSLEFYITKDQGKVMVSLNTCLELQLLVLNCTDTTSCTGCHQKSDISELTSTPVFGKKTVTPRCFQGIGLFPGEYHIEMHANAEHVVHPPRRVPESLKDALKKEIERMKDLDGIEKVEHPTDWVNSIVYVTKTSDELCICLDPKDLNQWVKRPHYYTQTLADTTPRLHGASLFTILDARSGYWNVKLDEQSRLLTTFNTPFGRFCFKRLPFGLISAQDV